MPLGFSFPSFSSTSPPISRFAWSMVFLIFSDVCESLEEDGSCYGPCGGFSLDFQVEMCIYLRVLFLVDCTEFFSSMIIYCLFVMCFGIFCAFTCINYTLRQMKLGYDHRGEIVEFIWTHILIISLFMGRHTLGCSSLKATKAEDKTNHQKGS